MNNESVETTNISSIEKKGVTMSNSNTNVLSKEQWLVAVGEFKAYIKDPENKPQWCDYECRKVNNKTSYILFLFYAILRGRDTSKVTHDTKSDSYLYRLSSLSRYASGANYYDFSDEINMIRMCFKSLEEWQVKALIECYFEK